MSTNNTVTSTSSNGNTKTENVVLSVFFGIVGLAIIFLFFMFIADENGWIASDPRLNANQYPDRVEYSSTHETGKIVNLYPEKRTNSYTKYSVVYELDTSERKTIEVQRSTFSQLGVNDKIDVERIFVNNVDKTDKYKGEAFFYSLKVNRIIN